MLAQPRHCRAERTKIHTRAILDLVASIAIARAIAIAMAPFRTW